MGRALSAALGACRAHGHGLTRRLAAGLAGALLLLGTHAAPAADHEAARERFLAAEAALARGDDGAFAELAEGLADYPLLPYLRFDALIADLGGAPAGAVEDFLGRYGDTPLAGRLRRAWLARLARDGRWERFLDLYRPSASAELRCHRLTALMALGRNAEALAEVEPLWLSGRSQPNACDSVFEAWRAAGRLTPELAWARIGLALDAGETRLGRYLGRYLPESERPWLARWLDLRAHPERVLEPAQRAGSHPLLGRMLADAIVRLARRAPAQAAAAREAASLDPEQAARCDAAIGLALAEAGDTEGLAFLDRVPADGDNQSFQERRLRLALELRDWARVAAWIEAMPEGEPKTDHWRYWQARAAEAQGDRAAAERLYREAAEARSLWGFLAAERSGLPYRLDSRPAPVDPGRVEALWDTPAVARIRELRALGRDTDARREWRELIRDLDAAGLIAAARVAERLEWPDQAIFTLARSGFWDDLELRFPLHHQETVAEQAGAAGLPESLVFAVLRQESAFNPAAASPAGARGLMQLMPATARAMAGRGTALDLHDPVQNIALGSRYLARVLGRFGGHPGLAAAAYNAGPGRVERWLPATPTDADLWIATIPFAETRAYVRRVLAYRVIYDHRLGRPIAPLGETLRPVSGQLIGQEPPPEKAGEPG